MRSTPRFVLVLAMGGLLLAPPSSRVVLAETVPTTPARGPVESTPQQAAGQKDAPRTTDGAAGIAKDASLTPAQPGDPSRKPAVEAAAPANGQAPQALVPAVQNLGVVKETDEEERFVQLANMERAKRGLSQLVIDPTLITVARQHSSEMRDKSNFNHV